MGPLVPFFRKVIKVDAHLAEQILNDVSPTKSFNLVDICGTRHQGGTRHQFMCYNVMFGPTVQPRRFGKFSMNH